MQTHCCTQRPCNLRTYPIWTQIKDGTPPASRGGRKMLGGFAGQLGARWHRKIINPIYTFNIVGIYIYTYPIVPNLCDLACVVSTANFCKVWIYTRNKKSVFMAIFHLRVSMFQKDDLVPPCWGSHRSPASKTRQRVLFSSLSWCCHLSTGLSWVASREVENFECPKMGVFGRWTVFGPGPDILRFFRGG